MVEKALFELYLQFLEKSFEPIELKLGSTMIFETENFKTELRIWPKARLTVINPSGEPGSNSKTKKSRKRPKLKII